ncbi:branched-chain amino acid ABC transporter permease [Ferviditalea candida]|uniref:Branched-chain amino acid ABC transporter permease n=1 Tax=Ferviditalea candida TaxID=3108399 RepID=A0ABU5ZC71_9BACL|nr:branched-chain amino acid ABC transporter permease [Paenibacillaceae bacterium T2]
MVTFVFTIGMDVLFRYYDKITGGDYGISVPLHLEPAGLLNLSWDSQLPYYFTALTVVIVSLLVIWAILRSSFGYKLYAIREDSRAAKAVGINVFRIRLITFVVGSGLASLSGSVYVSYYKLIDPSTAFSFNTALNPVIYSIAGGVGNLFGGILGSALLVPLSSYLNRFAEHLPGLDRVVYGLLLMIFILLLPKGILGLIKNNKSKITEYKAAAEQSIEV